MKISIVIPAHNQKKSIDRCLDSVISQTHHQLEIIIVDDGSSDDTGVFCCDRAREDIRIIVVQCKNGGVSHARNAALSLCTGDYLFFVDGDDSITSQCVADCVKASENGKYDIVCFGYNLYIESEDHIRFIGVDGRNEYETQTNQKMIGDFVPLAKKGLFDFVTDKMIRTSLIQKNDVRFDSYFDIGGEDAIFILSLLPFVGSFKSIGGTYYNYFRQQCESMTLVFKAGKFERYYRREQKLYSFMKRCNCLDEEYLAYTYGTYILWTYESMLSDTCRLSMRERKAYLLRSFRKEALYDGFFQKLKETIKNKDNFSDYSKSSRMALKFIAERKFYLAYLLHAATILKNEGLKCRN